MDNRERGGQRKEERALGKGTAEIREAKHTSDHAARRGFGRGVTWNGAKTEPEEGAETWPTWKTYPPTFD